MPQFDICYLSRDGSLAGKFAAICDTEMQAKILAHAMKLERKQQIEVWNGGSLVYRRPQTPGRLAIGRVRPQPPGKSTISKSSGYRSVSGFSVFEKPSA